MWLTDKELYDLTHKEKPAAQARALKAMGIPYFPRPDGTLVVLRRVFDAQKNERQASAEVRLPPARRVLARQAG